MNFLQQLFSFVMFWKKNMIWRFRARFVNEYNSWVLETKEKETSSWLTLGERRSDADHELMAVKFDTYHEAMKHAAETGLALAYVHERTNVGSFFNPQWEYRIRLDVKSKSWVIETKVREDIGWAPVVEYINARRPGEYHLVPVHFGSYQQARFHAQKVGLDDAYKEVRYSDAALPSPVVDATMVEEHSALIKALPRRHETLSNAYRGVETSPHQQHHN